MFTFETTASQYQFSPSVGYFLADNLAPNLNLGYTAARTKQAFAGSRTTSPNPPDASITLRVGPYVQY